MDGFLREELCKLRLWAGASLACMRKAGGSVAIRVSDRAEKGDEVIEVGEQSCQPTGHPSTLTY